MLLGGHTCRRPHIAHLRGRAVVDYGMLPELHLWCSPAARTAQGRDAAAAGRRPLRHAIGWPHLPSPAHRTLERSCRRRLWYVAGISLMCPSSLPAHSLSVSPLSLPAARRLCSLSPPPLVAFSTLPPAARPPWSPFSLSVAPAGLSVRSWKYLRICALTTKGHSEPPEPAQAPMFHRKLEHDHTHQPQPSVA